MRRLTAAITRRLRRARSRWSRPIDERTLEAAVGTLLPRVDGLMVHSALGSCGFFVGGHQMIIGVLKRHAATVCMPTHTYCYPPSPAVDGPLFDPAVTGSVVGALTNAFWRTPGVLRSLHPTHSLGAAGAAAADLVAGHENCETPCGAGTPYKRMIDRRFSVLMLGATMDAYTFFHTAEHDAGVPYLYEPEQYNLRVRAASGEQIVRMWRQDMRVPRRFAAMDSELESAGLLRRTPLGSGELLVIADAASTHAFLVDLLRREPSHLVSGSHPS